MEKSKYIFTVLIGCFLSLTTQAATPRANSNHRDEIYKAYIAGDMNRWLDVIIEMENSGSLTHKQELELLHYYYGYLGYLIGTRRVKEAREYLVKGDALADNLMARDPDNALPYCYKGVFYGYKMGVSKWKAIKAGPESMRLINKAYKMDSVNVQVIADKANMLYYTPKLFGGNKEEALCMLEKAIRVLEVSGKTENNWFYLNLLTLYAQYCQEQGDIEKTLLTYTKIMKIEPGYTWVRDELYPATLQSSRNSSVSFLQNIW